MAGMPLGAGGAWRACFILGLCASMGYLPVTSGQRRSLQGRPSWCGHVMPDRYTGLPDISSFLGKAFATTLYLGGVFGTAACLGIVYGSIGVSHALDYPQSSDCCNCCRCKTNLLLANKWLLVLQTPAVVFYLVCNMGGLVESVRCGSVIPPAWLGAITWSFQIFLLVGWAACFMAVNQLRKAYDMYGAPQAVSTIGINAVLPLVAMPDAVVPQTTLNTEGNSPPQTRPVAVEVIATTTRSEPGQSNTRCSK